MENHHDKLLKKEHPWTDSTHSDVLNPVTDNFCILSHTQKKLKQCGITSQWIRCGSSRGSNHYPTQRVSYKLLGRPNHFLALIIHIFFGHNMIQFSLWFLCSKIHKTDPCFGSQQPSGMPFWNHPPTNRIWLVVSTLLKKISRDYCSQDMEK